MKILVAISSCVKDAEQGYNQAMRDTWLGDLRKLGVDYKFFIGNGKLSEAPGAGFEESWVSNDGHLRGTVYPIYGTQTVQPCNYVPKDDEIVLDCPDIFRYLPFKTKYSHKYAIDHGYDYVFQCFTDTYVIPERLLSSGFEKHNYSGWVHHSAYGDYCTGGPGYWLSAKACKALITEPITHWAEDANTGKTLGRRFRPVHDCRYRNDECGNLRCSVCRDIGFDTIISRHLVLVSDRCSCTLDRMYAAHAAAKNIPLQTTKEMIGAWTLRTDKDSAHCYCPHFYDKELPAYRDKPISLLEIGIQRGGSVILWDHYFKNAERIVGVDIVFVKEEELRRHISKRVKLLTADAYLPSVANALGNFDLIIDDGPHTLESQLKCLSLYLPHLKPGGMLVIEDITTTEHFAPLTAAVPPNLECKAIDLTSVNNRWDDLLFVVKRPA